jgi:hypothetical protein
MREKSHREILAALLLSGKKKLYEVFYLIFQKLILQNSIFSDKKFQLQRLKPNRFAYLIGGEKEIPKMIRFGMKEDHSLCQNFFLECISTSYFEILLTFLVKKSIEFAISF